jgi:hypothetical protein
MAKDYDNSDTSRGSGYGHRRPCLVGDVVSLGSATLIIFWVCLLTILAGLALGLYVG